MANYEDEAPGGQGHPVPTGPVVRPAADPERDRRIREYRTRERERFVRALDRFLDAMIATDVPVGGDHADAPAKPCATCGGPTSCGGSCDDCAAHRLAAALGLGPIAPAYWDRARETSPMDAVGIHQKAGYGVSGWPENGCPRTGCEKFHSGIPHEHTDNAQKSHYGVSAQEYRSSGVVEANPPHDQDCPCRECTHRNPDYVAAAAAGPVASSLEPCPMAYWYNGPAGQWEWEPAEWLNLAGFPGRMCKVTGLHTTHLPGDTFVGPNDDDPRGWQR